MFARATCRRMAHVLIMTKINISSDVANKTCDSFFLQQNAHVYSNKFMWPQLKRELLSQQRCNSALVRCKYQGWDDTMRKQNCNPKTWRLAFDPSLIDTWLAIFGTKTQMDFFQTNLKQKGSAFKKTCKIEAILKMNFNLKVFETILGVIPNL